MKRGLRLRSLWPWALLTGAALFILSAGAAHDRTWNPFERLIVQSSAPFLSLITHTIRIVKGVWFGYFQLVDLHRQNTALLKEVEGLQRDNSRYREMLATHERLQELLQFKETTNHPMLAAQVISRDPSGWFKSILINKGRSSGLQLNMSVVNAQGVVGRIVSVSADYAMVLLLIDQNSAVDSLIQRSRERGMVRGQSARACKLDYLPRRSDVVVGDVVITSGLGGVFPKGVPIGRVENVVEVPGELFNDVEIRPSVDFGKLEEVLVVLKEGGSSDYPESER